MLRASSAEWYISLRRNDTLPLGALAEKRGQVMPSRTIGVNAGGGDTNEVLSTIQDLEKRGVKAAWLTAGAGGSDNLTVFAAAAATTESILLGTCIATIWPRHPVMTSQTVNGIAQLSNGRFRFGVGTGHLAGMHRTFGADFRKPLTALREYIAITRTLLDTGAVEYQGEIFSGAHALAPALAKGTPIMAAALRPRAYEVCGEISDGAISWVSPPEYLRDVALPAMQRGADKAKRETPPLVMHLPVCVHEDAEEVLAAAKTQLATYPKSPFYQAMFAEAGFPEAGQTETWSKGMLDSVVAWGSEDQVAEHIYRMFDWGMGELICHVITAGPDAVASRERSLQLLGRLSG